MHGDVLLQRTARTVHQDVQPSETLDRCIYRPLHRGILCNVCLNEKRFTACLTHFALRRAAELGVDFGDSDLASLSRESERRRFCDPRAGTGDERDLSSQPCHVVFLLFQGSSRPAAR